MESIIYYPLEQSNLIEFEKLDFGSYECHGVLKQHGRRYAEVKMVIKKEKRGEDLFIWETSEEEIPSLYIDCILSTIKSFYKYNSDFRLVFKIIGGGFHPVDSHTRAYDTATFKALSQIRKYYE